MYTKEEDATDGWWLILDPQGDRIASVFHEYEADALLTHLNR